jgi:hypothetical protein
MQVYVSQLNYEVIEIPPIRGAVKLSGRSDAGIRIAVEL